MERGEGERLHAARRRRFWTILGALAALGALIGFMSGLLTGLERDGGTVSPALMAATAVAVIGCAVLVAYGSWRFFKSVDELELADNLWASLIGFYTYAVLFPAWWLFSRIEAVPDPNQWAIYGTSMLVATVAYFYRKWLLR